MKFILVKFRLCLNDVLTEIINECDCPSLKQTRKKKPQQDEHLLEIFNFLYPAKKGVDCSCELFSFCEKSNFSFFKILIIIRLSTFPNR